MPLTETPIEKFQNLLRELFQVKDAAELDFGIYRILKLKREQVEEFISSRLPAIIDEAFREFITTDTTTLRNRLNKLSAEFVKVAGPKAIDADGELRQDLRDSEAGQEYCELRSQLAAATMTEEQKIRVYNDLYSFFSRYYDDGDFITTRRIRYAGNEAYAIPYSGEEVVLHWATKDQYYVKTTEQLKNYRFRVRDYSVAFEVVDAAPQEGNNREKNRRFVISGENPVEWDAEKKTLKLKFEFRPLTQQEQNEHGKNENQKPQESLNRKAEEAVLAKVADATLKALLATPEGNSDKSLLLRHLNRFTRKNTSDYFIHKNLRAFLERELDYFIKSECLLLEELENIENPKLPQAHLMRARVVRRIAGHIIDFLAQVEEFQKKLFEKRKFVLRTEYCITLSQVPEAFWPEILANQAQLAEWRDLFALDDLLKAAKKRKPDVAFLRQHPTLVVDTKHFTDDFKWRLLASFDNLEEVLDGLLVKSENFQALNLLAEKYRERVKCIYIDPPYNTGNDEFLYRDNYQHACWLTMMTNRLARALDFLNLDGAIYVSIDEREIHRLWQLAEAILGSENKVAMVTVKVKDAAGVGQQSVLFDVCEYGVLWAKSLSELRARTSTNPAVELEPVSAPLENYKHLVVSYGRKELVKTLHRANVGELRVYKCVDFKIEDARRLTWAEYVSRASDIYADYNPSGGMILSIRGEIPAEGLSCIDYVPLKGRGAGQLQTVYFLDQRILARAADVLVSRLGQTYRRSVMTNLWAVANAGLNKEGGVRLTSGKKPEALLWRVYDLLAPQKSLVMDFFLGSGTASAVAQKTGRRWLGVEVERSLLEMALRRMKRVIGGDGTGISRRIHWLGGGFFAYCTLEQYEDALENITVAEPETAQTALELYGDDYLLKYMLDLETRGSASLLNVEMFKDPFDYKLQVQGENGRQETTVDLVETFNYLLGLDVRKLRQFEDGGRKYRAVLGNDRKGKSVVVVWRSVKDIEENKEALLRDREFIEKTVLPTLLGDGTKPDRLFVNGASFVENAEAIEPEFKRLMFAPLSY